MNTSFMKGFYKMTKEELALEVIDRLKKEYPLADCTLDYDEAWKLLVSVRLAAHARAYGRAKYYFSCTA